VQISQVIALSMRQSSRNFEEQGSLFCRCLSIAAGREDIVQIGNLATIGVSEVIGIAPDSASYRGYCEC
jgi:hypothetical protein